jgi:hypothetical protein
MIGCRFCRLATLATIEPEEVEYTDFVDCAHELAAELKAAGCEERHFLRAPFKYKSHHFTKTGSGQTSEKF